MTSQLFPFSDSFLFKEGKRQRKMMDIFVHGDPAAASYSWKIVNGRLQFPEDEEISTPSAATRIRERKLALIEKDVGAHHSGLNRLRERRQALLEKTL